MYNTPFCICYTEKYSINCITSHCTNQQTRSVFIYLSCNVLLIFFWGTEYFTGDRRLRVAIILWNLWLLSSVWFSVITYFLATKTMQVSHHVLIIHMYAYYTPRFNEVERGIYWFHLVRLSVGPFVLCPSVDRIVSVLYLQPYSSDPFHIGTFYQATSERLSRVMFVSKFKHLEFWLII